MDNEKNLEANVDSAIDSLLDAIANVSPKEKKQNKGYTAVTNSFSTTHVPAGFKFKNLYTDAGDIKENNVKKY